VWLEIQAVDGVLKIVFDSEVKSATINGGVHYEKSI